MSRLSDAWAALCGRPRVVAERAEVEREVRVPVLGDAVTVTLYAHATYTGNGSRWYRDIEDSLKWDYYLTCEQAHKAHPGRTIKSVDAILVSGQYFVARDLKAVTVAPKPKRAKGANA